MGLLGSFFGGVRDFVTGGVVGGLKQIGGFVGDVATPFVGTGGIFETLGRLNDEVATVSSRPCFQSRRRGPRCATLLSGP